MSGDIRTLTRRHLLKRAVAAAAWPYVIGASAFGKAGRPAPSNRVTMGFIGLGSMGMRHIQGFLYEEDCQIVAVCDVDAGRRREAVDEVNSYYGNRDCAEYNDFRDLIARADIDALCISVPDHWHSITAILGIRAGKDIYGEKPLALTVKEGRAMVEAVNRYRCVWQTGSWQRSTAQFRFACELVRNKRIGELESVEVGLGSRDSIGPQPVMPVPEGFDYEMWLGPAPWVLYTEKRCHWNFRWILDYSGGQVTDLGAHHIDIAHWGMGADDTGPIKIEGRGAFPTDGLWNTATTFCFECKYANGVTMKVSSDESYGKGVRFIGDEGWVFVSRSELKADPERLLKEKIGPEEVHLSKPSGDNRQGHRRNFLDCVKTRAETISPVEVAHRSVTIAHLGNIAMLLGRKIRWDPQTEQIVGDATGSRMLSRAMRAPWHM